MAGYLPLRQDLLMRVCDRDEIQVQKRAQHFLAGHSGRSRLGKIGLFRPLWEPIRAQLLVQTTNNMTFTCHHAVKLGILKMLHYFSFLESGTVSHKKSLKYKQTGGFAYTKPINLHGTLFQHNLAQRPTSIQYASRPLAYCCTVSPDLNYNQ